jgi:RNA polymerase sigma-70 factor (ECF subfamily)
MTGGTPVAQPGGMTPSDGFHAELLPHLDGLRALARRLGPIDVDDLVQETYLRALQARRSYRAGSNARAWLGRILVNTALSEHRRRRRERALHARIAVEPPPEPTPPSEPMPGRARMRRALGRLPAHERRVIELADLDGLRYRDVARALGCPVGTVMSRLHRARRRLRLYAG